MVVGLDQFVLTCFPLGFKVVGPIISLLNLLKLFLKLHIHSGLSVVGSNQLVLMGVPLALQIGSMMIGCLSLLKLLLKLHLQGVFGSWPRPVGPGGHSIIHMMISFLSVLHKLRPQGGAGQCLSKCIMFSLFSLVAGLYQLVLADFQLGFQIVSTTI